MRSLAFAFGFAVAACGVSSNDAAVDSRRPDEQTGTPDPKPSPPASQCGGGPGTAHAQTIDVDGEKRVYELHVPASFTCDKTWPLLVDFHGAYGGETPEQAYINDDVLAEADAHGAIVARLRSRKADGFYRWDNTPADVAANQRFAKALVAELVAKKNVDPARVVASGYSSGGNMAATFLALRDSPFRGLAIVAAGLWSKVALPATFSGDKPRVYMATGYRDLHHVYAAATATALRKGGYDDASLFVRETDDGHAFLRWHVDELLGWLVDGKRPSPGAPKATWRNEDLAAGETLLEVASADDGTLFATGASGGIYMRAPGGAFAQVRATTDGPVVALAARAGRVVAASQARVWSSADGGATFEPLPSLPVDPQAGIAYANGAAIGERGLLVAGSGVHVKAFDGPSWSSASLGGTDVQTAHVSRTGTGFVAGRFSVIARFDATTSAAPQPVLVSQATSDFGRFFHAVASSGADVWVVGEHGTVLKSADDGRTFSPRATPVPHDLYAVAFRDAREGIAVGAHGAAIRTHDGGATWVDVSIGEDRMLAGVTFGEGGRAVAVGERGLVRTLVE